ncbi:hypothetical protein Kisp01_22560 [Kineosporia sp. NBRC 101677]|nr:hypothetical protein Kisp01_22560 [Kineosporia sp. NBRC 101677]
MPEVRNEAEEVVMSMATDWVAGVAVPPAPGRRPGPSVRMLIGGPSRRPFVTTARRVFRSPVEAGPDVRPVDEMICS